MGEEKESSVSRRRSGCPNTKVGAQEAERRAVVAALGPKAQSATKKEVPTLREFSTHFMAVATAQNRPSSVDSKRVILDRHILPHLGDTKLDAVRYGEVQDLKLKLLARGLGPKTVNNVLSVLRRLLEIARKRELIAGVPDMEWLKSLPYEMPPKETPNTVKYRFVK